MSSVPVVDLHVVRMRRAFAALDERLQTQQEHRPLRAAVMHELDGFLPTLVLEAHDRELAFIAQIPTDLRADPFLGAVDDFPEHATAWHELEDFHVEAAAREAELEDAIDRALAARVVRPPGGEAF